MKQSIPNLKNILITMQIANKLYKKIPIFIILMNFLYLAPKTNGYTAIFSPSYCAHAQFKIFRFGAKITFFYCSVGTGINILYTIAQVCNQYT